MPPTRPPTTLFTLALPVAALTIRRHCDAILNHHGNNPNRPAAKHHLEHYNQHLLHEVPRNVLDRIRHLYHLSAVLYVDVRSSLAITERITTRQSYLHRHFVCNICPRMCDVTVLDLREIVCSFGLFRAVSAHCRQLGKLTVDTTLEYPSRSEYTRSCHNWERRLLLLVNCKKLQIVCFKRNGVSFLLVNELRLEGFARLLLELPELRVFDGFYKMCSVFGLSAVKDNVYRLTYLTVDENSFKHPREIHWLNEHCPFVTRISWFIEQEPTVTQYDPVLLALAESNLKIEVLMFPRWMLKFSDALTTFLTAKGKHLTHLHIHHCHTPELPTTTPTPALTYDNLFLISECCPNLEKLGLLPLWYEATSFRADLTRHRELFANVRFLTCRYHDTTALVLPLILRDLRRLEILHCSVYHEVKQFLALCAAATSHYACLKCVELRVRERDVVTMLEGVMGIAMTNWPSVRLIVMMVYPSASVVTSEYVRRVNQQMKERNKDLYIVVKCIDRDW